MLVDFHTHLHAYRRGDERDAALECIRENAILTVASSVDRATWDETLSEARSFALHGENLIIPTFGIHPSYCAGLPESEGELAALLEPYLCASPVVGEIGLDFYWEKKIPHETQERVFRCILDHCERTEKYCVVHTKGAESRIADILADFPHVKPVIHWYDGPDSPYDVFLSRGYMQTFGCEVRYSDRIKALLDRTPLEFLLSETDNPTGEVWLGGEDSSPLLIKRVVHDIAKVKGIEDAEAESILQKNAEKILAASNIGQYID
ncbi:TatD family hydrolase [Treponema socranskii]|uniref:TatD family hydrolase n=1 Tax=Treponema socranskii TaxID=53419 RepID=UPI003D905F8B